MGWLSVPWNQVIGIIPFFCPLPVSDTQPESQCAVTDQLQGRVQGQWRPIRLPEARPIPGGHQLLRGSRAFPTTGWQWWGWHLLCHLYAHLR